MTASAANPLWDFSLAVYAAPGVVAECLRLQDDFGIDVNLLLFAAWIGAARGIVLSEADLAAADRAVSAWRDTVVVPFRAVRRQLKIAAADLYADAKTFELKLEQVEQARLHEYAMTIGGRTGDGRSPGDPRKAVHANIALCLARHGASDHFASALAVAATPAVL